MAVRPRRTARAITPHGLQVVERTLRAMSNRHTARLDFGQLIAAVENAPPVAAADVLGERLRDALGASHVSFLIADLSGQALIRLGHAGGAGGRSQGRET